VRGGRKDMEEKVSNGSAMGEYSHTSNSSVPGSFKLDMLSQTHVTTGGCDRYALVWHDNLNVDLLYMKFDFSVSTSFYDSRRDLTIIGLEVSLGVSLGLLGRLTPRNPPDPERW